VLSLDETVIFSELTDEEKAQALWDQYQVLLSELKQYDLSLLDKPFIISLSKADLYSAELIQNIKSLFRSHDVEILPFSAVTRDGIQLLQHSLRAHLQ
jgi:GTPase involved in cell partitioning and DNA repair